MRQTAGLSVILEQFLASPFPDASPAGPSTAADHKPHRVSLSDRADE